MDMNINKRLQNGKVNEYECQRVITLHALTEIHRIIQIEENISINCQTLTYVHRKGHGRCTFSSRITIPREVQVNLS